MTDMSKWRCPLGPYANPNGRLNGQGKAFVIEWLKEYPSPISLLVAKYKRTGWFRRLMENNDGDEVASACFSGVVKAAMHFDPKRGLKFQTYAAQWMWGMASGLRGMRGKFINCIPADQDFMQEILGKEEANIFEESDYMESLRTRLGAALKVVNLNPSETRFAALLFPSHGAVATNEELGAKTGYSKHCVREFKKTVVQKLRMAIKERGI